MGIGEPSGALCICALTTAGRRPERGSLPGRSQDCPVLLAQVGAGNRSRDNHRDGSGAPSAPRLSPSRPEARALTSTENTPTTPEIDHAETGAPAPEEIESHVEQLGGAPVAADSPLFSDFDVHPDIVAALTEVGITRTFAIQELMLPLALAGNDLIGQARTGTGK